MKKTVLVLTAAAILAAYCNVQTQSVAAPPGDADTKPAASAPSSKPASKPAIVLPPPRVLATIGNEKITSEQFDLAVANAPRKLSNEEINTETNRFIREQLMKKIPVMLADEAKIEINKAKYDEIIGQIKADADKKQMSLEDFMTSNAITEQAIKEWLKVQQLREQITATDKIDAFIKAHPEYFDGTKVKASHILVMCAPTDDIAKQKAASEKVEKIAKDIKDGKISFEDAAKQSSEDYSKERGCELGEFTYGDMVPLFSNVAFATAPGQISAIVRTEFGFHIIKVDAKVKGENASMPLQIQQRVAGNALLGELFGKAIAKTLTDWPIKILYQPPQTQSAPAEK